jgi:hypothetical protein
MAYNEIFRNLNNKIDVINENFEVGALNIQLQLENFMMKFANSNWNSNLIFSLTVRATQTEENSDYNENNGDHDDNENLIRNDKSGNNDDNSSSDDPI